MSNRFNTFPFQYQKIPITLSVTKSNAKMRQL